MDRYTKIFDKKFQKFYKNGFQKLLFLNIFWKFYTQRFLTKNYVFKKFRKFYLFFYEFFDSIGTTKIFIKFLKKYSKFFAYKNLCDFILEITGKRYPHNCSAGNTPSNKYLRKKRAIVWIQKEHLIFFRKNIRVG